MTDTPPSEGSPKQPKALAWAKAHIPIVAGLVAGLIVLIVLVVVVVIATSASQGKPVAAGAIVQSGPLTSGYRVSGKILKHTPASVTVHITRIDASAGEARNVALRSGKDIDFSTPADGVVALARNGHEIASPSQLHDGDQITLVGQFAPVVIPPAPPHDGYAFFGIEASSK